MSNSKRASQARLCGICQDCGKAIEEGNAYRRKVSNKWQVRHYACKWISDEPNQAQSKKVLQPKAYYEKLARYNRSMIK